MLGYTSEWGTGRPAFSEFLRKNLIGLSQHSLMATHHAATYLSLTMMMLGGASWYYTQRLIYWRGATGGATLVGLARLVPLTDQGRWVFCCRGEVAPPP